MKSKYKADHGPGTLWCFVGVYICQQKCLWAYTCVCVCVCVCVHLVLCVLLLTISNMISNFKHFVFWLSYKITLPFTVHSFITVLCVHERLSNTVYSFFRPRWCVCDYFFHFVCCSVFLIDPVASILLVCLLFAWLPWVQLKYYSHR